MEKKATIKKMTEKKDMAIKDDKGLLKSEKIALSEFSNYILSLENKGEYWLLLEDDRVIYNIKLRAVFPNFFSRQVHIETSSMRKFNSNKIINSYGNFKGFTLMSRKECMDAFLTDKQNKTYYRNRGFTLSSHIVVKNDETGKAELWDGRWSCTFNNNNEDKQTMYIPLHYLDKENMIIWNATFSAITCVRYGLFPKDVKFKHYEDLKNLYSEYANGRREIDSSGNIVLKNDTVDLEIKKGVEELVVKKEKTQALNTVDTRESEKTTDAEKKLLECDKVKFSFMSYNKDRLYDLESGHWDIYKTDEAKGRNTYITKDNFVARNPLLDVQRNGVVAIDFGTKSTVVVYKNGSSLKVPLRIGTTNYSKDITDDQYENPTIEEIVDFKAFVKAYNAAIGRPSTSWKNLIIANLAANDMKSNSSVLESYYSYFSDLKQWASGQTEAIITDQKGYSPNIKNYKNRDSECDLIELYAYYIGLHINNMENGIFLDYKLSYPVSFDLDVKEKIRESFENGIRKSIPEIVQKDEKVFKKFKVRLIASEPAAYATCALQQYNIETPLGQAIFYGVFDFGGGTSDYDFGLWQEVDDDDSSYSFVLNRLGSIGDPYLGGENLLEMIAYEVLKNNVNVLKKEGITFVRPAICERFVGDESVVAEPQTRIAKRNLYIVKEELRKFWEGDYSEINDIKKDKVKIEFDFINKHGIKKNAVQLEIVYSDLYSILKNRITAGVILFEQGRKKALSSLTSIQKSQLMNNVQYIFMAGNSCKSPLVKEAFSDLYREQINNGEVKVLSPLQGKESSEGQLYSPNGKTGVAWGLLDIGDSVEFIDNEIASDGKIEFKYCLGNVKKGKFIVKINSSSQYDTWIKIVKANKEQISIYYTDNLSAESREFNEYETNSFTYNVDYPDDNKYVYIRLVDSVTIEIVAAFETDIEVNAGAYIIGEGIADEKKELYVERIDLRFL